MDGPDPRPLLALGLVMFALPVGGKAAAPGWRGTYVRSVAQLRDWPRGANLGVGCRANGLVVLDLDCHQAEQVGAQSLAAAALTHGGTLPATFAVATPSGGRHVYWRLPPGRTIGSTSHGRSGLGPGIDTRGPGRTRGGYVVGPGSVIAGRAYAIEDPSPIAELPAWIADLLERHQPPQHARPPVFRPATHQRREDNT
jgi:hypothetical protein